MLEPKLIKHAGLDSAVYLLGLKIFVPLSLLAFLVMVFVNWTKLEHSNVVYTGLDNHSISDNPMGSNRFWTDLVISYALPS